MADPILCQTLQSLELLVKKDEAIKDWESRYAQLEGRALALNANLEEALKKIEEGEARVVDLLDSKSALRADLAAQQARHDAQLTHLR